jgi:DNA-binding transcriptional ArsR family regulator
VSATTARPGQGSRSVEETVSYAVGHRIRIEILAALNEATRSPDELARIIRQPLSKLSHHIRELVEAGSIEVARTAQVRNTIQHFYRAVAVAYHSDEEHAALSPGERQATYGVILQAIMAESLASFWAEKMIHDPRIWLSWHWFNVDTEGREAIADEQARHWARVQEIEAESTARRIESNEEATSIIVASMGFERCKTSPTPPPPVGNPE